MDGISALDNSQQDLLWQLLFTNDATGTGNSNARGMDNSMQGIGGQGQCCQGQNGNGDQKNGITYNNSGIVININFNFNFVNAMA